MRFYFMMSRYQTVSLALSYSPHFFLPSAENVQEVRQQRGNFFFRFYPSKDSLRIFPTFDFSFLDWFLVSFQRIDKWRRRPSGEHHILRVRKQMLEQNNFFSQFQITAIIFFVFGNSCHKFPFLAEFYKKSVWRNSHHVQMNVEKCVCVFYRRSFFLFLMAKDVSNSLRSYKGGNKNVKFRLSFFFCFIL